MTNPLWVIQTGLQQEDSTVELVKAFSDHGIKWAACHFPPFQNHIPDFNFDGPIVYYGSTSFIEQVYKTPSLRKQAALLYDEKDHSPTEYGGRLGKSWLNQGALLTSVGEFLELCETAVGGHRFERFIKPAKGLKDFAGKVYTYDQFKNLVVDNADLSKVRLDTEIIVNNYVSIKSEIRTWVVEGCLIDMIGYRSGDVQYPWDAYHSSPTLYYAVKEYAEQEARKLAHLGAFVLDIAVLAEELKVIEVNCIHAAGFYDTKHISNVVRALDSYVSEHFK